MPNGQKTRTKLNIVKENPPVKFQRGHEKMPIKLPQIVYALYLLVVIVVNNINGSTMDLYKNARLGTRIVQTRYGRLQGLILPLENFKFLKPVEAFLGVPYATPPTKTNR